MPDRFTLAGPTAKEENMEAHLRHLSRSLAAFRSFLEKQAEALRGVAGLEGAGASAVAEMTRVRFDQLFPAREVDRG